jgi:tetratricopeptide (TPR) repeat protein/O-antigen ligase
LIHCLYCCENWEEFVPSSKLSALCERIIEAGWLAAVVVTPLFFNFYSRRAFEADKLLLLRSIVVVMAAAWIIRWIEQRRAARSPTSSSIPRALALPTLFLSAVYLVTTITSIAPRISFFGSYTRVDGAYTILSFVLIFFFVAQELRTRQQLNRLTTTLVLAGLAVALYAWVQNLRLDPIWGAPSGANRIAANLGDAVYLGAFLTMTWFLSLGKVVESLAARGEHKNALVFFQAALFSLIAMIQAGAIFFSNSRGPWLSGFAGLVVFGLLLAWVFGKRTWARAALGLALAGALGLLVLNLPIIPLQARGDAPGLDRLGHIFNSDWEGRPLIWQGVARLVQPHDPLQFADGSSDALNAIRPLVGYGPETMYLVFERFYPPALTVVNDIPSDTMVGRSHNEVWDALVTGGLLGLVALQFLFFGFFLYGLERLGLVSGPRARIRFGLLWAGLAVAGGAVAWLLGQASYLGVGVGIGNVLGLLGYLALRAIGPDREESRNDIPRVDQIAIAALVSGVVAHYTEIQFGYSISATDLLFWMFAAMVVALGAKRWNTETAAPSLGPEPQRQPVAWLGRVAAYGLITAIILATQLDPFVSSNVQASEPLSLLWRALTVNGVRGWGAYAILVLVLATWALSFLAAFNQVVREQVLKTRSDWLLSGALFAIFSLGLAVLFGLGLATQLVVLEGDALVMLTQAALYAERWAALFDYYVVVILALTFFLALVLLAESRREAQPWLASRWSLIALAPLAVLAFWWTNVSNLDSIRADIIYNRAQAYAQLHEWDFAIALDQRAIAHAPYEDVYYRGLGLAFLSKAQSTNDAPATGTDSQVSLEKVLGLSAAQTAALSSQDSLYAARASFAQGQALNALNADHLSGLAQVYSSWAERTTDGSQKAALLKRAEQYSARATYLRPHDAGLWNQWASLDLDLHDPDAALDKLQQSLRQDPRVPDTYMLLGQAYAAKGELENAATAYRAALARQPQLAAAQLQLARIDEQQSKSGEAIQAFTRYLQLAPDAANAWEVHQNLALLYRQDGDLGKALSEAQLSAALAPNDRRSQLQDLVAGLRTQAGAP